MGTLLFLCQVLGPNLGAKALASPLEAKIALARATASDDPRQLIQLLADDCILVQRTNFITALEPKDKAAFRASFPEVIAKESGPEYEFDYSSEVATTIHGRRPTPSQLNAIRGLLGQMKWAGDRTDGKNWAELHRLKQLSTSQSRVSIYLGSGSSATFAIALYQGKWRIERVEFLMRDLFHVGRVDKY